MNHPPIADRDTWRKARLELLEEEKAHTRAYDAINAKRRRLPMVEVDPNYEFDTEDGKKTLLDLFEGRTQLFVYHFMFAPDWEKGCSGCTSWVNAIGDISDLAKRDTTFVIVSRAPLPKLLAYKQAHGWTLPWVSSFGSEFNYDFGVSLDLAKGATEYNYKDKTDDLNKEDAFTELPGSSVFFRVGDKVYHTYSSFARGNEATVHSYAMLDLTPYGRQEDFEDSPEGWPQRPTYG